MKYYIKCPDFKRATLIAKAFDKHYSKDNIIFISDGQISVTVGENKFVFFYKGTHTPYIKMDDFIKKYFRTRK